MENNVIFKAKVLFNRIKHSPKLRKEARSFLRSKIRNRRFVRQDRMKSHAGGFFMMVE